MSLSTDWAVTAKRLAPPMFKGRTIKAFVTHNGDAVITLHPITPDALEWRRIDLVDLAGWLLRTFANEAK